MISKFRRLFYLVIHSNKHQDDEYALFKTEEEARIYATDFFIKYKKSIGETCDAHQGIPNTSWVYFAEWLDGEYGVYIHEVELMDIDYDSV